MGKIPKHILDSIHKAYRHNRLANEHGEKIRNYMATKGVDVGTDAEGILLDYYIDTIEQGMGIPEDFIEKLEQFLNDEHS